MKYQVLARKYRPHDFTTLMGQEHVRQALENALTTGRLHHAYLFSGTRGVGKTTIARVLAKALNCEQGVVANPCGECASCQEIDQGRFADLIEVDAASRTKVEDTRELLENVQYAPVCGRYKIYLIDEVHMLSGHSFNALLKTLEEPPEHVKFLLATTDPQKLPVTVLSRCLKFNLKRLSVTQIMQQLEMILQQEQLDFEPTALKPIAIAADGSMRDALSLTDQAIAFSAGNITYSEVLAMLGSVSGSQIMHLLDSLAKHDANGLVRQLRDVLASGMGAESVLSEIINILQQLALCQMVPEAIDESHHDRETLQHLSELIATEDIQLFYQIALSGRQDLELSPFPQGALEMILLRMLAFRPITNEFHSEPSSDDKKKILKVDPSTPSEPIKKISEVPEQKKDIQEKATQQKEKNVPQQTVEPTPEKPNNKQADTKSEAIISSASASASASASLDIPPQQELPPLDAYYADQAYQYDDMEPQHDFSLENEQPAIKQDTETVTQKDESTQHVAQAVKLVASDIPKQSEPQTLPDEVDRNSAKDESLLTVKQAENVVPEQLSQETESKSYSTLWHQLVKEIECSGLEREIFMHSSLLLKESTNDKLLLKFGLDSAHKELLDDKIGKRLKLQLDNYFNADVKLDFVDLSSEQQEQFVSPKNQEIKDAEERLQNARQSFLNDPAVNLLVNSFDGKIIQESIKPIANA